MTAGVVKSGNPPWERESHDDGAPDRLTALADEILLRCRGEGPANCVARCPLHVDARGYVQLTREGLYREALQLVRERLPFPGILGYVCTHPCELHCKRIDLDSAVRVRDIKRFLAEWEPGEPRHVLDLAPPRPQPIAVVGSGPAGLIAAHDLTRKGYRVTLFEREAEIGGCLAHKIPPWRLPRDVVQRDLSIVTALRIEIRTGIRVGRDIGLEQLRSDYPAVLLLCGYEGGLDLLRDDDHELRRSIRGTLRADPVTYETGIPGLFAGGEAVSGPATVIDALALGRRCGESARRHLEGRDLFEDREEPRPRRLLWTLEIDEEERRRRERTPILLQPNAQPLGEEEARAETDRCLGCECGLCVEDCEFLAQHCRSPKDLARRVKDEPASEDVSRMIYSCNVCALCATICPNDLDTGALLVEARREEIRRGHGPLPRHRATLRNFNAGISGAFSLLMPEPGRSRSKRLFFTGCSLPATAPGHAVRIYEELRKHYRGTGVLVYCCGAPVERLGMNREFADVIEEIPRMVDSVGAEELVTACPGCTETLKDHLPDLRVTTAWELLADGWDLPRRPYGAVVSIHDPCRARHEPGLQSAVRRLLEKRGCTVEEMEHSRERSRCCGRGSMVHSIDPDLSRRIADRTAGESPRRVITYCTECRSALARSGNEAAHLLDILFTDDWAKATSDKAPGRLSRYVNRFRAKWAFRRLRPLGSG